MNIGQHDYSFRNCDYLSTEPLSPTPNTPESGCLIDGEWEIVLPVSHSRLVKHYSVDLFHFLADAFGIYPRIRYTESLHGEIKNPRKKIILASEEDIGERKIASDMDGAFYITVAEDYVLITGKSERGTAQGVYYIEDNMRLYGKAILKKEALEHAPLFSPRMTHSGYELDTFSDEFLNACAHAGMDSIIVYAGHPDMNLHGFSDPDALWSDSGRGYCDFNNLVWRAEGYGLDVYVYSHIKCDVHPDEPNAYDYYEASFGKMFRNCPGIKGIIFVGETFEFPSKDPHTCGIRCQLKPKNDTRHSPGWYPCEDYPRLVTIVKNVIRQYNPQADIVFWTYNWGWASKEARLSLIENLPKDISLLVTFEMWEYLTDDLGMKYRIADYSLSFVGPSQVFTDEAEKAKEMGIRLYAMGNTGGRTWDVGSAPYIPAPQQWQMRYEALCKVHENYGLCGLMENHHFGWMPSFLSLFSKNAFTSNAVPNDEMLISIARRDYGEAYEEMISAWNEFSIGISKIVACELDQYGPYRCGPTYPLLFTQKKEDLHIPYVEWAWHKGGGIWNPIYNDTVFANVDNSLMRLNHICDVTDHLRRGVEIMDSVAKKMKFPYSSKQSCQIAVAKYTYCSFVTAKHVMLWNIAKRLLFAINTDIPKNDVSRLMNALGITEYTEKSLAEFMRNVAQKEKDNVSVALSCRQEDSRIGFEASMEYVFNYDCAQWKIAETDLSLSLLSDYINRETTR